ncbi:4-coumarate--CoA ligase 1-like [Scaptodrosophila lebanonensis]|uniref:4-coumarate--CoA ligase 1-like n=1 Tax=Drosophila lebanonensis TaxID=7225 RepID=A0A6J2UJ28_DROLE|nr:4-coumarate--CoA ligase 1-like [Scaptodrosophila lebanonensis]
MFGYPSNTSIGEIVFQALQKDPEKVAQISDSEQTTLTKKELLLNAIRIATYLRNAGIRQDDIVGIVAQNTTHLSALTFALFFNGIAYHSLNPALEEATFQKLLDITNPKIVFCNAENYDLLVRTSRKAKIIIMKPELSGVTSMEDILQTPIDLNSFRPLKLQHGVSQTLAIVSSSGTTGIPKAVTISNTHKLFETLDVLPSDIQYTPSTLDWISSLITLLTSVVVGTTRIISERTFDPLHLIELVQKYQITWLFHSPSHINMLLSCSQIAPHKLDSVRLVLVGGGNSNVSTLQKLQTQLRHGIPVIIYGLTEAGSAITVNSNALVKRGSVGCLVPGFRVKIINEDGSALGPGEQGEICFNNGQPWAGYVGNPEETMRVRDDEGWIHTGDIGYMDSDHYLYIVDRKKDLLMYRGMKYYPQEIEQIIAEIPAVSEVCVFGIWSELESDAAAAAVVKNQNSQLSASEILDFVKSKISVKYKHLNGGVFIVNELQKLPNGKLNRRAIKEACLRTQQINLYT